MKLTEEHLQEMRMLIFCPKKGTSSRRRDRLRKTLKRLGMIRFDRDAWQWVVLPAGRKALEESE